MISRALGTIAIGYACALAACASNPARASNTVPLDIPEPPPRVAMAPVPAVVEEPPPPQPEQPASPPPAAPAVRRSPAPPPAPAASSSPPPAPVTEPVRPGPPPELRPAGPAGHTPTVAQVRESLERARQKLDAIDRRRLNAGKRADYDSARRFLVQAEGAVKANNLLLAQSSVEKAETLADGLR